MKQSNVHYMNLAIAAAKEAKADGGEAIGAVVVHDATGEVIVAGGSNVGVTNDPTAHAEVNCIREVAQKIQSDDLHEYTLYSTLEPCHMCLSAAAWARITQVFFGAYRKDVDETLFDIKGNFSDEEEAARMNLGNNKTMQVQGGILESDCAELLGGHYDKARPD